MSPTSSARSNSTGVGRIISRRSFLKMAGARLGIAVSAAACDVIQQEEEATQAFELPLSTQEQYPQIPTPEDLPPPGILAFFTPQEALTV